MGRMVIVPWDLQVAAPCHTHNCRGTIAWKIVPDELQNVAPAIVAGICDACKESLALGVLEKPVQVTIGWREVDQFLREHRDDPIAVPLVEGAMGRHLVAPTPPAQKRAAKSPALPGKRRRSS